jgi:uncharacterized protein
MKLSIFCSPKRKSILTELVPLFDDMFIESHAFFFPDNWSRDNIKHMTAGLGYSDYYLIIPSKDDFQKQWIPYILGYAGHGKNQVIFYTEKNSDFNPCRFLDEFFHCSATIEELKDNLEKIIPLWSQVSRNQMARMTLETRMEEHAFEGLARAVEKGDRFMVGVYLDAGFNINKESLDNVTLLGLAARNGYASLVYVLCKAGANIDQISTDRNNTPLMDAASEGHVDIVRFFVENGANLEVKSRSGQTALMLAVGNKQQGCAMLLLKAGANADVKDSLGLSARKYAELYGMKELLTKMPSVPIEE